MYYVYFYGMLYCNVYVRGKNENYFYYVEEFIKSVMCFFNFF